MDNSLDAEAHAGKSPQHPGKSTIEPAAEPPVWAERIPSKPPLFGQKSECLNCGQFKPDTDAFCRHCGQRHTSLNDGLGYFINDFFASWLSVDGRAFRTVTTLLVSPGVAAVDFLQGKRTRYLSSAQTYLVSGFLFFVVFGRWVELPDLSSQWSQTGNQTNQPWAKLIEDEIAELELGDLSAPDLEAPTASQPNASTPSETSSATTEPVNANNRGTNNKSQSSDIAPQTPIEQTSTDENATSAAGNQDGPAARGSDNATPPVKDPQTASETGTDQGAAEDSATEEPAAGNVEPTEPASPYYRVHTIRLNGQPLSISFAQFREFAMMSESGVTDFFEKQNFQFASWQIRLIQKLALLTTDFGLVNYLSNSIAFASQVALLMLPLLAVLLRLFHWRSCPTWLAAFVVSAHWHAGLYLSLSGLMLLNLSVGWVFLLGTGMGLFLWFGTLRRVFRQSWPVVIGKSLVILPMYALGVLMAATLSVAGSLFLT